MKVKQAERYAAVDGYVAERLRRLRIERGLSQQQVAASIGVTYQQEHKYERGINRLSPGRLHALCKVFDVPVSYFFDGLDERNLEKIEKHSIDRLSLEIGKLVPLLDQRSKLAVKAVIKSYLPEQKEAAE